MAMRSKAAQALTLGGPAPQRGHVGLDPSLIDEDELRRIKVALPRPPSPPPARNVGARLLKSEQRFF
jgi:hypothetical protein